MPETPEFPAGNDLWERVDETPLYPTFPLWRAKQGPAELPASPPLSRGSLPVDDVLFSREVTKFDGISARRLTLQAQASPLEKLFSRLIAARNALPPLPPRPSRRPLRARRQVLAIPPGHASTASGAAGRQNRETARVEEFRRGFPPPAMGARPWSLLATPLQLDPWVRDLPQHLPEQLHNDAVGLARAFHPETIRSTGGGAALHSRHARCVPAGVRASATPGRRNGSDAPRHRERRLRHLRQHRIQRHHPHRNHAELLRP